jgi:hypothetical protein
MEDLTKKVETIERRLNELVADVRKTLVANHTLAANDQRQCHARRTTRLGGPIEHIFKCLNEISAELGTVKSRLDALGKSVNTRAHELQQEATMQKSATQESRPQESPVALNQTSTAASPEQPPVTTPSALMSVAAPPEQSPIITPLALPSVAAPSDHPSANKSVKGPVFQCGYKDIEKLNEAMFEKFSSDPIAKKKGYFKLVVHDLPPLKVDRASICQPGEGHFTNFSCQLDSQGFVQLIKRPSRKIALPHLPLPDPQVKSWSCRALKEYWEDTLKDPPRDMTYIIGDPLFSDVKLSSGQGLEKRRGSELPGVGTTYAYLGFGVSGSIMHGEDADLCSMNLLRSGATKSWLIVEPGDKENLEHYMRQEFPMMKTCAQALRDLSRFIPPSKLDVWGIRYSLDYTNPGEAICTLPRAFHQVRNHDTNYALATNVLCDTSNAIPKGYKFCDENKCGHSQSITEGHLRLQERRPLATLRTNDKQHPPLQRSLIVQRKSIMTRRNPVRLDAQVVGLKRKIAPAEIQPKKPKIAPQIELLSHVVCGKEAFHRLSALVYSWRNRWRSLEFSKDGCSAARLVCIIGLTEEKSQLVQVLSRIAKVELAEIIDKGKGDRTSADPTTINKLIGELKWEHTKANRQRLHDYLKEGRQWKKIRGTFDGLLCLIPTPREGRENASHRAYYELAGLDLQLFHSLLDSNQFIKSLCQIGNILGSSISNNTEIPQFKWEREDSQRLSRLSIAELAPFIEVFPQIKESMCHFEKYNWPKPDCWPWEWPQCPNWIPSSDKRCDLCNDEGYNKGGNGEECSCILSCLPETQPRITNEPGKGQGIRAIDVAYAKNQILGELLGEIAPLDTFNDDWTMVLTRRDLDEPIAQIWTKEMGNWVGKVNHSCEPSAKFCDMRISGLWRPMLIAIRDIPLGSEITASCGTNFLRSQGKVCHCDKCNG